MYISINKSKYTAPKGKKTREIEPTEKEIREAEEKLNRYINDLDKEYDGPTKKGLLVGAGLGAAAGAGMGYLVNRFGIEGDKDSRNSAMAFGGTLGAGLGAVTGSGFAISRRENKIAREGRKADQYLLTRAKNKKEREALKRLMLSRYQEPRDYVTENGEYVKGRDLHFDRELMNELKRERSRKTLDGHDSFSARIRF